MITGPTREAVLAKLHELLALGGVMIQEPELADGQWTAVCEKT